MCSDSVGISVLWDSLFLDFGQSLAATGITVMLLLLLLFIFWFWGEGLGWEGGSGEVVGRVEFVNSDAYDEGDR